MLRIDLSKQVLRLLDRDRELLNFPVSTALVGAGELNGSGCTPRGNHRIRIKIGSQYLLGADQAVRSTLPRWLKNILSGIGY